LIKVESNEEESYKFFWQGGEEGMAGVGVLVKMSWVEKVVEVRRVSERIMLVKLILGRKVLNVVTAYAPQVGRSAEEKDSFWCELMELIASVGKGEEIVIGGDLNGHVGKLAEGYDRVHGGFGYGSRNEEGERILELCEAMEMKIVNTWFQAHEEKLITYMSGESRSMLDYILVRVGNGMSATEAQAVYVGMQHKLVVSELRFEGQEDGGKNRKAPEPTLRIWKLKDEQLRLRYAAKVQNQIQVRDKVQRETDVNGRWEKLKEVLLAAADEVCGWMRGQPTYTRTMKWNDTVQKAWEKMEMGHGI
jgi:hypothetical protein